MFELQWPWALALLPLPWLVWRGLPRAQQEQEAALRVPYLEDFSSAVTAASTSAVSLGLKILLVLCWLLLVLATTRPQWVGDPLELPVSGRDLMLAVDLSGSMEIADFEVNGQRVDRLTATKFVARDFIGRRKGDRLGLILFGEQAYLQTPLTFDLQTVNTLLMESAIGLAGKATAIGDAIGLAIKRLRDNPQTNRILILLTDGANTAGEITPLKAAELAAKHNLKIYTIGIGADEMVQRTLFGQRKVNPSVDLDEDSLIAIAAQTGGRYFRARDTEELEKIYAELNRLEPVEVENQTFRPVKALYMWPLGAALLLGMLMWLGRLTARSGRA
jgi:Ca-activated chloride channel family protein